MSSRPSVQLRLMQLLAMIAVIAVVGVLAILPYRLYERDIRNAQVNAHRLASVVHVSLGQALHEGGNVTDLVNRLQSLADLEIGLRKLDASEVHPAASGGRVVTQTPNSTSAPPSICEPSSGSPSSAAESSAVSTGARIVWKLTFQNRSSSL